jgi:hypothetical protein
MRTWRHSVVLAGAGLAFLAGCGGGSSPAGPATPTPAPTPTPAATPSPTPTPCVEGACGNTNAVTRVRFRLYMVFDRNGDLVTPTPDPVKGVLKEPIPVGYKLRFDVIGEDSRGKETNGQKNITWIYTEGANRIEDIGLREDGFQRDVKVAAPGDFSVYVVFDDVASNSIAIKFVP